MNTIVNNKTLCLYPVGEFAFNGTIDLPTGIVNSVQMLAS